MPGLNAVGERFKTLVESFEPGVHQFFPLELFRKDGTPVDEPYYIFNCTVSFDSILLKHSEAKWVNLDKPEEYPRLEIVSMQKQVLSKQAIEGHHIWSHLRQRMRGLFVSDAFHKQLKKNKIKYLFSRKCEELDVPWIEEENLGPLLDYERKHGLEKSLKPWLKLNPEQLF